ncbi:hypothetical protein CBR_g51560 [Chara braunii]|uniref:phytol kinase n=1 Tax=Chara braunii TaxID=69332 RepID=A0A388M8T2_CHABU|nr:hypothetical protein CBR_g51560 [Chara braunii]|eukprot:GBG90956.1 hypothetical protein CBR_g51560 [Chara braunii]
MTASCCGKGPGGGGVHVQRAPSSAPAACCASIVVDLCARRLRVPLRFHARGCERRKGATFSTDVFGTIVRCGRTRRTTAERRAMEGGVAARRDVLSHGELQVVAAALSTIVLRCQQERALGRLKEHLRAHRQRRLTRDPHNGVEFVVKSEAVVQLCYALGCGVIPRATPRWWVKRRTGGTWEDLRLCDDATNDYFRDKLRMSPRVFREIVEACAPHLQRHMTFYMEPLQPDQIVAYALYRWASGETYESSTCNFGIGRASGLIAVHDVTAALLRVFGDKIAWPTGVRKQVVLRAFADKGFSNCHGCIDCTHIYVDKPANAPSENYYDRKRCFSIVAQVVVDLDLHVLDAHMGYPGSCHGIRVLQLSSLLLRVEEGSLFRGPPVTLSFGVKTNNYLLADNGYLPAEWMVVSRLTTLGGFCSKKVRSLSSPVTSKFNSRAKAHSTGSAVGRCTRRCCILEGRMWLRRYFLDDTLNDTTAMVMTIGVCLLWLRFVDGLLEMRLVGNSVARKIIHTGTGPIFMLMWNFYSSSRQAPYFAAFVIFLIVMKYFLVGVGLVHDPKVVLAVTRRGNPKEILLGPMFYGLVVILATTLYWRHSPTGILVIAIMCGGDGLADIVGRRFGTHKIFFSPNKSWSGSLAMLLGSFVFGFGMVAFFNFAGNFYPALSLQKAGVGVAVLSVIATIVEALPIPELDNLTVAFTVWIVCCQYGEKWGWDVLNTVVMDPTKLKV